MADSSQPPKEKTAKELAKEKVKAEKAAKFAAKQAKSLGKPASSDAQPKAQSKKPVKTVEALPEFVDTTPPGQKKQIRPFDDPHMSAYSPKAVESAWYSWWEESGFFKPQFTDKGELKSPGRFVIPLPPPNVTGALHCGHAMANALQDTLIRWHRMKGYTTVWVPGCDHAGISTQSVVEKTLWTKEKKTRHDLGREKFTELVWDWKDEYHRRINNATKLMGGSMDWSREAFTMDENLSAAVLETFCRLHDEGYIYRSNRLVNWCTQLNTALSNLEVDNKEIEGRTLLDVPGYERKVEFGVLTHFKYEIDGEETTIEVATTRPETMLGDSGIAVHPKDERYAHLVGKYAKHPFIKDRLLKIVADDYVDPEFGTGAVKLTPGHDFNDYQLGQRHKLEFINILNDDGTLNNNAGPFAGQKRFDARYTVVQELEKLGLFVKKEPNPMKIPLCNKSKDVIEPLMKPQWWMRMKELANEALKVVEDGQIKIAPDTAKRSYERWLAGITDWCLSRQLWWGHRIPAYFIRIEGDKEADESDGNLWVVGRTEEEAKQKADAKFPGKKFRLERDADCLDTWFSSGLWPMSILGWPNTESLDFQKLFPTSLLETGWDILFFWVARMIMLSLKLTGKVPFSEVFCHSLIRDSEGRKMSKSLGNVIDPLDIINGIDLESLHAKLLVGNLDPKEIAHATKYQKAAFPQGIPECGTDALRFTLVSYTTGGGDINFDIKIMHGYRRFCNKVWQASKYVLGKLPENFVPAATVDEPKLSVAEKWILSRMNAASKNINEALAAREFSKSTQISYQYFYDELCDVFIENSKAIITDGTAEEQHSVQQTLYRCLDTGLRILHPFMPFLTEELWQRLPRKEGDSAPSIMVAEYPEYDPALEFHAAAESYELVLGSSKGLRSLTSEYSIRENGRGFVKTSDAASFDTVKAQLLSIKALSGKGMSNITVLGPNDPLPTGCAVFVVSSAAAVFLEVKGRVDVSAEITKAQSKLKKAKQTVTRQKTLLEDPGFGEKVSETVKDLEKKKLIEAEAEIENYEKTIEQFEKLKLEGI